jgi:hypothetical protein
LGWYQRRSSANGYSSSLIILVNKSWYVYLPLSMRYGSYIYGEYWLTLLGFISRGVRAEEYGSSIPSNVRRYSSVYQRIIFVFFKFKSKSKTLIATRGLYKGDNLHKVNCNLTCTLLGYRIIRYVKIKIEKTNHKISKTIIINKYSRHLHSRLSSPK